MNKNEFLRELRNSLDGRIPSQDIEEVLADYEDIFKHGKEEGKNEDEISIEIGSPANISRNIIEDSMGENRLNYKENIRSKKEEISNLAGMGKRLWAYIIDVTLVSVIFMLIAILSMGAFTSVTGVAEIKSVSENGDKLESGHPEYRKRTILDADGNLKKIELYKDRKKVFKGSEKEYYEFVKENSVGEITTMETVTAFSIEKAPTTMIAVLPMVIIIMLLGAANIITAFELWIFNGYTLGKKLMNIRVVRKDGKKVTFLDAILRDAVIKCVANGMTSGILNIGSFIWANATEDHKTLQDLVANTKVIDVRGN